MSEAKASRTAILPQKYSLFLFGLCVEFLNIYVFLEGLNFFCLKFKHTTRKSKSIFEGKSAFRRASAYLRTAVSLNVEEMKLK